MKIAKFKLIEVILVVGLITMPLVGCITGPDGKTVPDVPRIAATTREAAQMGTAEALFRKPEWREQFVMVANNLAVLEAQPDITVNSLLRVVQQLPVNELRSHNAQLIISSARLLVASAKWADTPIERVEQMKPVIEALREGILAGIAATPATP